MALCKVGGGRGGVRVIVARYLMTGLGVGAPSVRQPSTPTVDRPTFYADLEALMARAPPLAALQAPLLARFVHWSSPLATAVTASIDVPHEAPV